MLRDIYLHGAPGRTYGRHFRLDVSTPHEAVRALSALRPPLRSVFREGVWRVVAGPPRLRYAIEPDQLGMRLGSQPLHIVPATRPAGSAGGVGKIVVGVALVGAAIVLSGGTLAAPLAGLTATAFTVGGLGVTYGTVAALGVSMVLAGTAGLLSQGVDQSATSRASPQDQPSFLFNGVTNNTQPGGPVPLVYGTHMVGSIVVSAGINVGDIPQWYT
jgi:predicted phage tail protein